MLPLYTYSPSENLRQFQSSDSRERYLCTNSYALIQIGREDQFGVEQYINFYIRPMNGGRCAIILFLPELVIMKSLLDNKGDMVAFMNRDSVKDLFKTSSSKEKIANHPFIAKIKDFTSKSNNEDLWVIENIININFSQNLFVENSFAYNALDDGLVNAQKAANLFLESVIEYYSNLKQISYIKSYHSAFLLNAMSVFNKEECYPQFINKIENLRSDELKEALLKHGIVFQSDSGNIYPIGCELDADDYAYEGFYLIKLDLFSNESTLKDFFFYIQLNKVDNLSSFKPCVYVGEINSTISDIFNNIDINKYSKFDSVAYKLMPKSSKIWFYSNPYHEGLSISKFVEEGDTSYYDFPGENEFVKREGDYLTYRYLLGFTVAPSNIWGEMDTVLSLTRTGMQVILEFLNFIPHYKKRVFIKAAGHFVDGATFWLNPVRKIIKWLS